LEDKDFKVLFSRKLAFKGYFKDVFVNILTIDFNLSLVNIIKIKEAASCSLLYNSTLNNSI
jgi:hypothetical protein